MAAKPPTEQRAFDAGRRAFLQGADRLSCPFPAPFIPSRTPKDAEPEVAAGLTVGAFWLDGFEQQRDGEIPKFWSGVKVLVEMPLSAPRR